jgi:tetratricopeptide (TPR) repeat protein
VADPTIVLMMIVKDEARVMRRCLASLKHHIHAWAIVDTGSTDGTQDIIRRELANIPGKLVELPWKGFAGSRNDALQLAREVGGDYAVTIDADEELVWPAGHTMAPKLEEDCYGIRFRVEGAESTWQRTLLIKLALPWRWVGDMHEHLACDGHEPSKVLITGAYVLSHTDGGRSRKRKFSIFDHLPAGSQIAAQTHKFRDDAKVLERMASNDPDDPRNVFYLAQSYMGARELDKAIATYQRRATMGGWEEEVYYSLWMAASLMEARGDHWENVARAHIAAYESRPCRAEPLWALSVLYNDNGRPALAEVYARAACALARPNDVLHVLETVYQYRAADEHAAALGKLGRFGEALAILERLVKLPSLPDPERQRAEQNIRYLSGLLTGPASSDSKAA